MVSVKNKSVLDGEDTSAVQASSAIIKSGSSTDMRSHNKADRTQDSQFAEKNGKEGQLRNSGKRTNVQSVEHKKGQQKTVTISDTIGHQPGLPIEGTVNDSMILDDTLPETTKGIRFKNTQGRHKKTICRI